MNSFAIAVRPVDRAPFAAPFILAVNVKLIANFQIADSWSLVNVVSHQQSLSVGEFDNKSLMPIAPIIIRQNSNYSPQNQDLNVALALLKSILQHRQISELKLGAIALGRMQLSR